jgi:hypothetical protein
MKKDYPAQVYTCVLFRTNVYKCSIAHMDKYQLNLLIVARDLYILSYICMRANTCMICYLSMHG